MAVSVHYNEGYTTMCNHHLRDRSLSWQAKGMLSFMFSNREDFKYSINGLTQCASNGDTSVRSILNELKDKGYLIVTPIKGINGRIECWNYDFFETPDDAKRFVENPHGQNQHVENQVQRNTNISNSPIKDSPIKNKERNTKLSNTPLTPQGEVEEVTIEEQVFEEFRKVYLGRKRGCQTELDNLKKKHKDWREVLPLLKPAYERQCAAKIAQKGKIDPQYEKNLQTYINNRCWEEEVTYDSNQVNMQQKYADDRAELREWCAAQPKLKY